MAEEKQLQNLWIAGQEWLGIDRLQLNKAKSTTVTTELEDGTQQETIVWEDSGDDVVFFDTSDATAKDPDIVLDKTAYSTDKYGNNSKIKGTMLPLNLDASLTATPDDVYLQYSGKNSDSDSYFVPTGEWTFNLNNFKSITNFKQENMVFTVSSAGDKPTCTGIQVIMPIDAGNGKSELLFEQGENNWALAASRDGTSNWVWENWSGTPDRINITKLPSEGLSYECYTFLMTAATPDSDSMSVSVQLSNNAYIPGTGEHIRTFSVPGLASLLPSVVKEGTIIPGIHDSEGNAFTGTLKAADIKRLSDDSTNEGYKTLVIK